MWANYLAPIPESERDDLMRAYHRRLFGDDPAEQLEAARAWTNWEWSTSQLIPVFEGGTDEQWPCIRADRESLFR
ncbi:MAG: hypothetical protein R2855_10670 [Thermomicrobiales bacterium]